MQPAAQGLLAPQLPPHEARPLAFVRSCRAETVPAQRTAVTIAVSNTVLIFFIMTTPFLMKSRMTVRILRSSFAAAQALFQRQQAEMAKSHFTSAPAGRPTALPVFRC